MSGTQDPWAAFDVPKAADPWAAFDVPKQPSALSRFGHSVGVGARDVIEGAGQLPGLAYDAASLPLNAGIAGYNALTGSKQPYIPSGQQQIGRILDAVGLPKAQTEGERIASAINRGASGALAGAGLGGAMAAAPSLGPVAQGVGRVMATQPAMQAASGAVGGGVGEATGSPVAGLLAGAAVPLAAAGARSLISPFTNANTPGREALVAAAEKEGIPLTAGQATGSPVLRKIETSLEQMPLTSGPQRAISDNQREKFIESAWKRAGIDASDTSPETLLAARDKIGGTIGQIADRNTMQFTPDVDNQLATLAGGLDKQLSTIAAPMRNRIEEVFRLSSANTPPGGTPSMPGTTYRQFDTELGKAIKGTDSSDLRNSLGELRTILRNAMDASISPADKDAWDVARRQYANYKVIESAAGQAGAGAAEGTMSPVALRQALASSVGKEGYATGRGDMNELSRIGQSLLRPSPDSGTAGLAQAHKWLTGGVSAGGGALGAMLGGAPGAAAGAVAPLVLPRAIQMLMNSQTGQAYLKNQLATDPVLTSSLAKALALHGATQMGAQALPQGGP